MSVYCQLLPRTRAHVQQGLCIQLWWWCQYVCMYISPKKCLNRSVSLGSTYFHLSFMAANKSPNIVLSPTTQAVFIVLKTYYTNYGTKGLYVVLTTLYRAG